MSKYHQVYERICSGSLQEAVLVLQQITGVGINTASNVVYAFSRAMCGQSTGSAVMGLTDIEYHLFNNLRHS